jgi:glycosyltransferase involved in cell wall biosynthesis
MGIAMAGAPQVSIVIPTRNRRTLLAETIDSILAQTLANWELIVVDDASEDDTFSYVSGLGDRRIRAMRLEQHAERSAARNTGLDVAKGEFILFLDDDDLLIESGLQTHVDALVHHPAAVASVGSVEEFDERGARSSSRLVRHRQERDVWPDVLLGWGPVCGRTVFRTRAMQSVQGWNTTYNICEDHELWLRLSRLGPVVLLPEAVYRYRIHSGQWRPPKRQMKELLTVMRQRAVRQLDGKERRRGEQILAAREQFGLAMRQYRGEKSFRALISFLKVVRLFPAILKSPLMGRRLRRRMMRSLIGGQRVVKWWRRRFTGGKVDYSVRSIERSSKGRVHPGEAGPAARQRDEDD